MKEITLTQGYVALVDDEDYEDLMRVNWYACICSGKVYARHSLPNSKKIFMHRYLIKCEGKEQVDHIDSNGINNQRSNLRKCTHQQNVCNRSKAKTTTSIYLGVHWKKDRNKWRAAIKSNDSLTHLGYYQNQEEAALAYNKAAISIHGEFAKLNKIAV